MAGDRPRKKPFAFSVKRLAEKLSPMEDVQFRFLNATLDLKEARQRDLIRQAFQRWQDASVLRCNAVAADQGSEIAVACHRGNHGGGEPFDNGGRPGGNTLAHAFLPLPAGGSCAGSRLPLPPHSVSPIASPAASLIAFESVPPMSHAGGAADLRGLSIFS